MVLQDLSKSLAGSFLFLIAGCASEKESMAGKNAEVVYTEASKLLAASEYEDAAKKFKDVETYFPYAEKASRAQIMSAYCNFMASSYIDAIRELDIFLRYHPSHALVSYALYLKAMSLYMGTASVGRDSQQAMDAKRVFVELINRFPSSKYANDSLKKIAVLDDIIAAHEMMIGRFYQKNKNALAAITRYNYVVSKFPNVKCLEEAYYRIAECCQTVELYEEAKNAIAVLQKKFPQGIWAQKAKNLK